MPRAIAETQETICTKTTRMLPRESPEKLTKLLIMLIIEAQARKPIAVYFKNGKSLWLFFIFMIIEPRKEKATMLDKDMINL